MELVSSISLDATEETVDDKIEDSPVDSEDINGWEDIDDSDNNEDSDNNDETISLDSEGETVKPEAEDSISDNDSELTIEEVPISLVEFK